VRHGDADGLPGRGRGSAARFRAGGIVPRGRSGRARWPAEGLPEAGLDAHSYVAVLAHDEKLDVPALETALRADCRYVGLLGSAHTREVRHEACAGRASRGRDRPHPRPDRFEHLGGIEPAEIAVAILAELIMARRGTLAAAGKDGP
jgi:xanthine dehydrogenase accessory factor